MSIASRKAPRKSDAVDPIKISAGEPHRDLREELDPWMEPDLAPASVRTLELEIGAPPAEFVELFMALELRLADAPGTWVIGVTSAVPGEGKTTLALHLAISAARSTFKRVALIDLSQGDDVRRTLGLPSDEEGITELVEGDNRRPSWLQIKTPEADLLFLPGGRRPANPARVARAPEIGLLLQEAQRACDIVVVDLPAVATGNMQPVMPALSGAVMVVHAGVTPREVVSRALSQLDPERVLGVVLNRAERTSSHRSGRASRG